MDTRFNGTRRKDIPEQTIGRTGPGFVQTVRGSAVIEYLTFLAFILAVLITMGVYTRRGIQGKWKETIQTVSAGRVYGSKTKDCYYDARAGVWADSHCYDAQCLEACSYPQEHKKYGECLGCIRGCRCAPLRLPASSAQRSIHQAVMDLISRTRNRIKLRSNP